MGNRISPTAEEGRFALPKPPPDIQPVIVRCRGEAYVFIFTGETQNDALRWAGRHAANPDLNFSWQDCAIFSKVVSSLSSKGAA